MVHDYWSSHFKTACKTNQICTAHLIRELDFFEEKYDPNWATNFKRLLYKAYKTLKLKKKLIPNQYKVSIKVRDEIELELENLLEKTVQKNQKVLFAFLKQMTKHKDYIFDFLHHYEVPPDNNASV